MKGDAMRAGAARALEDVLRNRRPDLAFEIGGQRGEDVPPIRPGGTVTSLDDPHAGVGGAATATNVNGTKRAA